ncbi:carboxylesterase/lipase family protein [Actinomadura decatromicini]|uniref:Carboxylic ester hydrolase n=1 Tax=Actinomadura decatromicini TaxID=2604572 RepID=A0A5D3FXM4_9ACTN|nr:carboxylesterase family protein [Actinomadura decatromicini]TYK52772.1 carboxylesterase family protein [Actinomadura decatromicini]
MRPRTALKLALSIVVAAAGLTGAHAATAAPNAAPACSDGTAVQTDTGPVCGIAGSAVTNWLGVPYAAPPLGALRWAPPAPHPGWTTPLQATELGSRCPQPADFMPGSTNEDCLKLNVRVPKDAGSGPLPVMVQLHGGGFRLGSPSDGSNLAAEGKVIQVEVTYRLGIIGFLSHAALGANAGNYGLQDQQAALGWVKRNIAKFGGDPANVTIFGPSAGGSSVCANMASPTAHGLFAKGIIESGEYNGLLGVNTTWQRQDCATRLPTQAEAQQTGARFAAAVGCGTAADVAACLRQVPVQTLLDAAGDGLGPDKGTLAPIVDGKTLTKSPGEAFATGDFNKVPVIHGVARDETQMTPAETPAQYEALINQHYGTHAPEVLKRYKLARFPDPAPYIASRTVLADASSVCPALLNDRRLGKHVPVYAYRFDDTNAPPLPFIDNSKPVGAFHVGEFSYLFHGTFPGQPPLTPNQKPMRAQLVAEWTGFARGGDPTVKGAPRWTPFTSANQAQMSLLPAGDSRMTSEIAKQHHCGFWLRFAPFTG